MTMFELFDLASPQQDFVDLIAKGGYEAMPGSGISIARVNTEYLLRHPEEFTSNVDLSLGNVRPMIPLNVDPPMHSKYRKLLDPLFAPKRMDEQEADITRRVNGYIDAFIDAGECNFSEELAELFPSSVFLGLMGLPEDELRMFLGMRDGVLHPERLDPNAMFDMETRRQVTDANGQRIYAYFGALIDERTARPTDDIITGFLQSEIDGDRLTREDILDICFLLLFAGLDTVSATLTSAFAFLATHPDHQRMIVQDPSIIPAAVEEILRWESPAMIGVPRIATCPVDLPTGVHVETGTAVMPCYGAANVDPSAYDDPLEVRFDREVNSHIAFGAGVHRCLGSHLARRELRVALREWHARIPEYWIKPGHEQLDYRLPVRGVDNLTLAWR